MDADLVFLKTEKAAAARKSRARPFVHTITFLEQRFGAYFLESDSPGLNPSTNSYMLCDNLSGCGFPICRMEIIKPTSECFLGDMEIIHIKYCAQ